MKNNIIKEALEFVRKQEEEEARKGGCNDCPCTYESCSCKTVGGSCAYEK